MMMEAETGMPMSPSVLAIIFCCRLLPSGGAGGTGGSGGAKFSAGLSFSSILIRLRP